MSPRHPLKSSLLDLPFLRNYRFFLNSHNLTPPTSPIPSADCHQILIPSLHWVSTQHPLESSWLSLPFSRNYTFSLNFRKLTLRCLLSPHLPFGRLSPNFDTVLALTFFPIPPKLISIGSPVCRNYRFFSNFPKLMPRYSLPLSRLSSNFEAMFIVTFFCKTPKSHLD